MLGLPNGAKIFFYLPPTDMRKRFDRLCGIVEGMFEQDVLDGHLFLFVNRRQDRINTLWWEPGGLVLWYKRLKQGTFKVPRVGQVPRGMARPKLTCSHPRVDPGNLLQIIWQSQAQETAQ